MRNTIFIPFLIILLKASFSFGQDNIKLSVQTGHSNTITVLEFSPDGTWLVSAGVDNNAVLWDVKKRKQAAILHRHSKAVRDVSFHPNGEILATVGMDGMLYIWSIPTGELLKEVRTGWPQVNAVSFSPSGEQVYAVGDELLEYNFAEDRVKLDNNYRNIQDISFSRNGNLMALSFDKKLRVLNYPEMNLKKVLRGSYKRMGFSQNDKYLTAAGTRGNVRKWSVEGWKPFKTYTITAQRPWHTYFDLDISENTLALANKDHMIYIHNHNTGKLKKVIHGHDDDVRTVRFSPDGQLMASSGIDQTIGLWDLKTSKRLSTLQGIGNRVNDVLLADEGETVVIAYDNGSLVLSKWNETAEMKRKIWVPGKWKSLMGWEYSVDEIISLDSSGIIAMIALRKPYRKKQAGYKKIEFYKVSGKLGGEEWSISPYYSQRESEETKLHGLKTSDRISVENDVIRLLLDGQQNTNFKTGHTDFISSVNINEAQNQLITSSWDGLIKVWDLNTGKELLNYATFNKRDFIYITPEKYYYATKGALDGVGFVVDEKLLSFDQFDTKFNRPDIVFSKLPWVNDQVVKNYRLAYEKRLSKLGVEEEDLAITSDIPILKIENEDLQPITRERNFDIQLSATDKKAKLDRLHVLINGVPVYGTKGLDIEGEGGLWQENMNLRLNPGKNNIQIWVSNEFGTASFKEELEINCTVKGRKPNLYLVTVGASEFKEEQYNLNFAAKDARDISSYFRKNKLYGEVFIKEFINSDVTLERLNEIDEFLSAAQTEDVVIISVAGHGVLDANLDYYLSTYDMDFSDPSKRGLPYTELENFLDKTASRKKTLLVDACHSGELDKEEVQLSVNQETEFGEISFRNVGPSVEYKSEVSLKSSFELSKMLFADMRANNGSTVISSAGGAEYAIEGKEWKNGVFTFALLNGLSTGSADLNGDGKVMLSEIQQYLLSEVPRITNGRQTPTSRVENLNNDFRIE